MAAAGGVLNYISGYHRPFSLTDISLAYPNKPDIVPISVLVAVAFIAPACIIFILCILTGLPLARFVVRQIPTWRATIWDIHAGWLGLVVALATALVLTSGLKDMVGKPRPDLLSRCNADLSAIPNFIVGGFGNSLNSEAESLVTSGICQQTDKHLLDDGFAAFPSGHSSFSSAGLVYLSLWLCARMSLAIPYLDQFSAPVASLQTDKPRWVASAREGSAAPPLWQLAVAFAPIAVTLFICASRYADFHHAGVDITAGAILGTVIAWASFRLYHLPVRRGEGFLSWAHRSPRNALFAGAAAAKDNRIGADYGQSRPRPQDYELHDVEAGNSQGQIKRVQTESSDLPILSHGQNHRFG